MTGRGLKFPANPREKKSEKALTKKEEEHR
jgi:hypothetical protein